MGDQGITKKEQIMQAALTLFSEKGYDGVGVDEIADTVGMTGPALYHYFRGKKAILDGLIQMLNDYYDTNFNAPLPEGAFPETLEEFLEVSRKRLEFTIHDPQIRRVRRLLAMEQFRNDQLRILTSRHHLTGLVEMNTSVFERLIVSGQVKNYDPELLAFEFTAPITMLVHLIDREPEREAEAWGKILQHMEHFNRVYSMEG